MNSTCHAHLMLLDFINIEIFGEECIMMSSPLCNSYISPILLLPHFPYVEFPIDITHLLKSFIAALCPSVIIVIVLSAKPK
jgi:hypothetical protein